jgi:hypothetical protein
MTDERETSAALVDEKIETSTDSLIFEKLLDISAAIGVIEKDGYNSFSDYRYASIDNIMQTVQKELIKRRLVIIGDILEESVSGNTATVAMLFTFIDAENPHDRFTTRWVGEGTDKGDKALSKAITAATKQMLLKTFLLASGEVDPDSASEERKPQTLSDEQQREIFALLEERGLEVGPILETCGVANIHDVPAHQFNRIKRSIEKAKPK